MPIGRDLPSEGPGFASVHHVVADPDGDVVVGGNFWGPVDFGQGPRGDPLDTNYNNKSYVLALDDDGM
jgi:hypothetical protein